MQKLTRTIILATLIGWLANCGSVKDDGTPNASGSVLAFVPGTTNFASVYGDSTESAPLQQPIPLNAAGKATVYANAPVDLQINDSNGAQIGMFLTANGVNAKAVELENAGFTGTTNTGTLAAGGKTSVDAALSSLAASLGGPDGLYQESPGATGIPIATALRDIAVSVRSFGAKGDGSADDTSAIQRTVNEVKRLSGGIVYFPPGTYILSSAVTLTGGLGVAFKGAGQFATVVQQNSSTAGAFVISGTSLSFEDMTIQAAAGQSTGSAISGSATGLVMEHVTIGSGSGGSNCFDISLDLTSASSQVYLLQCTLIENNGHGAARGIRANTVTGLQIIGGVINNSSGGAVIELIGTTGLALANVSLNGGAITSTVDPQFSQIGTLFGSPGAPLGSGSHYVPNLLTGDKHVLLGQSTGAAYVIDPPTPTLGGANINNGKRLTFVLHNDSGALITGWTFDAIYHRSATAISLVDAHRTTLVFEYDVISAVWREVSISDST